MDTYNKVAFELAQTLALRYSTSFGSASKLYDPSIRHHIFNIYAWVRIADEIVDTYRGSDSSSLLETFRQDTYQAIVTGFSTNPIIHAFSYTVRAYDIEKELIDPFILSMAMDLKPPKAYSQKLYKTYIYGSAQVVGLMCLKVFCKDDVKLYDELKPGAESLGAAFQKVNFLRDFAADTKLLGRSYFPNIKNNSLTEANKHAIIKDIKHDFTHAIPAMAELPKNSRLAVRLASTYYFDLLKKLESTPASVINSERIRVPDWRKAQIFASVRARDTLTRKIL